jgi:hypothetical protein
VDSDQDFELWEELDDDFVTNVNDGKPALVLVAETEVADDTAQQQHPN